MRSDTQALIEAENKFAVTAGRLDKTDHHIGECQSCMTHQYTVIDKLKNGGPDAKPAERVIRNMMEIHDLYVGCRRALLDALNRQAF